MEILKEFERGKEKPIYCPLCGEEMGADLHGPEEGWYKGKGPEGSTFEERISMDNWICPNCEFLFDRADIETLFEKKQLYKEEGKQ